VLERKKKEGVRVIPLCTKRSGSKKRGVTKRTRAQKGSLGKKRLARVLGKKGMPVKNHKVSGNRSGRLEGQPSPSVIHLNGKMKANLGRRIGAYAGAFHKLPGAGTLPVQTTKKNGQVAQSISRIDVQRSYRVGKGKGNLSPWRISRKIYLKFEQEGASVRKKNLSTRSPQRGGNVPRGQEGNRRIF